MGTFLHILGKEWTVRLQRWLFLVSSLHSAHPLLFFLQGSAFVQIPSPSTSSCVPRGKLTPVLEINFMVWWWYHSLWQWLVQKLAYSSILTSEIWKEFYWGRGVLEKVSSLLEERQSLMPEISLSEHDAWNSFSHSAQTWGKTSAQEGGMKRQKVPGPWQQGQAVEFTYPTRPSYHVR